MPKPSSNRSNLPSKKHSNKQFGTYLSNSAVTRAGQAGSINTDKLKEENYGFGVFAYYTGTKGYTDYNRFNGSEADEAANFMFNQKVSWNSALGNEYITKWEYSPLKYWPNEVINDDAKGVDDQDDDKDDAPATTNYGHGGNVSFFAYAPYVELPITAGSATDGLTSGIIAINKNTTLTEASDANEATTDPTITYVVATDGAKVVDLLWGTRGNTSNNVNGDAPAVADITGTSVGSAPESSPSSYVGALLKDYKTNIDLTKQKTNGTIDFLFKHATAKVGGSTTTTVTPPDPSSIKNGLMVVLDLDDMKGKEVGGEKEAATKVTVKEIKIEARSLVDDGTNKPGESGYTATYLKTAQGDFNLATGKWDILKESNTQTTQPTPTTYIIDQGGTGANVAGELNENIKEPSTTPAKTEAGFNGLPAGVLTTAQNVYKDEAYPLVFIPGTYPELTVTVDYLVRTKDGNLTDAYSQVEQKITKKLTFEDAVKLNKQYSLLIHLGLTSVKFTASVSDWDVYSEDGHNNFDSDGDGVDDILVEDVYLPINVSGLIAEAPATIASNASSFVLTALKYYVKSDEQDVLDAASGISYEKKSSGADIINISSSNTKTVNVSANITFTDRTETFVVKYTKDGVTYESEPITITQSGRIAESAKVTFETIPTLTKASGNVDYTSLTVTASGKESDNTTAVTDQSVNEAEVGTFVFKDAAGNLVTWIKNDKANKKFIVEENGTGAAREAYLWIYVGGKLVQVVDGSGDSVTLTQPAA